MTKIYFILIFIGIHFVNAQPYELEGSWNNGNYNANGPLLGDRIVTSATRVQATTSNFNRDFLFNNSGNNYTPKWAGNSGDYYRGVNTFFSNGAKINGAVNLQFPALDQYYYTFIVGKNSGGDNDMSILETAYNPKTITSVTGIGNDGQVATNQAVPITATLSGKASSGENVYLRYADNPNFTSSSILPMTGSGPAYSATIPGQASVSQIYYYIFTSNLTITNDTNVNFYSLEIENNNKINYTYRVLFANLQLPKDDQTIIRGNSLDVYAQVKEPGITYTAGVNNDPAMNSWIGYSTVAPVNLGSFTTTDWTWIAAPFLTTQTVNVTLKDEFLLSAFGQTLNNEFTDNLGTYFYVSRFKKGSTDGYIYGGSDGQNQIYNEGPWNGTGNVARKITVDQCTDNTWNGSTWSLGHLPNNNERAIIDATYSTSGTNPGFESCQLVVNAGKTLTINSNDHVTVKYDLDVKSTGSLTVENDGNLLQTKEKNIVNSGSISAKRNITLRADRNQYNYLISPVKDQNLKTVYPNIDFVLYHNEANNKFYPSTGAYIPGRALAVKVANAATSGLVATALFTGMPANGPVTYPLEYTGATLGYNLVGNPFASNIDLDTLYNTAGNSGAVSATFYFWDNMQNTQYTQLGSLYTGSSYAVFNAVAGGNGTGVKAPNASGSIQKVPNKNVKVSQGFMVKSLGVGKTLTFKNSMRTFDQTASQYFGKSEPSKQEEEKVNRFYLEMLTPDQLVTSMAVVYFEQGKNSFSEDDSEVIGNPSEVLYSVVEDKKLLINGKAPFLATDQINLGAHIFSNGNYTLSLGDREGIFADGQSIYLKDRQTGIVTKLNDQSYSFRANAGESSGRIEIIYQPDLFLGTNLQAINDLLVYKNDNVIKLKSQIKKIDLVEIFDMAGRLIYSSAPKTLETEIPSGYLSHGVYLIKIERGKRMECRKIIY